MRLVSGGASVPAQFTVEGAWPDRSIQFGSLPWSWDFGTNRWTYGSLRSPSDAVTLTQTAQTPGEAAWQVRTSANGPSAMLNPLTATLDREQYVRSGVRLPLRGAR